MTASVRYQVRYRDGYYVVIDTETGAVVPPDAGHYSRHKDGYLWDYAAAYVARDLNETMRENNETMREKA